MVCAQVGPNRFIVWIGRNSLTRQSLPWEPFIIAYNLGDNIHRGADRPAHIELSDVNNGGATQTLSFPPIPDQKVSADGHLQNLTLSALASSGLDVQFFMIAGI